MKAKTKQTLYLILEILGLVLAAVAKFLPAQVWNKAQIGAVIGVGARIIRLWACQVVGGTLERKKPGNCEAKRNREKG